MPTLNAVKTGNWSDPTVWDLGRAPLDGDVALAGAFTITFDMDVNQPNTLLNATTGNFRHSGAGTRNVIAQANAGTHTVSGLIQNTSTGTLNFNGAITGGSGGSAHGANNTSSGTLIVTTATGGSGGSAHGANNTSNGTLNVTTATGGSGSNAHGANNTSNGTLNCDLAIGNLWGPGGSHISNNPGVVGSNIVGSITRVRRIQFGAFGAIPVGGAVLIENHSTNSAQFRMAYNGATKTLTEPTAAPDYPAIGNVRLGTIYANGDRVGTCAVPAAQNVAFGVPVDATTGTAVLTPAAVSAAVWDKPRDAHTTDGTFGKVAEWAGNVDAGAIATAVWSHTTRTLSSFGSLVADITTAVWGAAQRTLTAISDSSGVTTLLSRIIGTLATGTHQPQSGDAFARLGAAGAGLTALGDTRLANLDVAVSSRHAAGAAVAKSPASLDWAADVTNKPTIGTSTLDEAGVRTAVGLASANLDAQLDALPTAAEAATAVRAELATELGRIDVPLSTLPGAVDATLSASHGPGLWGGAGSGANSVMYTVTSGGLPLAGVYCRLTTDAAGLVNISAGMTNSLGQVTFWHNLPSGTKVYIHAVLDGYVPLVDEEVI